MFQELGVADVSRSPYILWPPPWEVPEEVHNCHFVGTLNFYPLERVPLPKNVDLGDGQLRRPSEMDR